MKTLQGAEPMTDRELAACMQDWAEFGWVILTDRAHVEHFTGFLEQMNIKFTIDAKQKWYSIQKVSKTV